ncbi:DUF4262 domain-containing protein [Parerythrobacter aurantius]|uniref:DUF4262 domain-containing protein n=1 Tax=Parerythrobacter aurantius TaxID=3127706 RepID=UPI0032538062
MTHSTTLDPQQQAILDNIERFGLAVMHVASEDPRLPSYSYSVGFKHSLSRPEVLVYGLDQGLAQSMINEVFRQCQEDGLELTDGRLVGNLIEGYDCMVRPIDDPRARTAHLGYATWFERQRGAEEAVGAVQIVWPDPKTRAYPWQPDCGADIRGWQVQLYPAGAPR